MACMLATISSPIASTPPSSIRWPSQRHPPSRITCCVTGGDKPPHIISHFTPLSSVSFPSAAPISPLLYSSEDETVSAQDSSAARILNPGLFNSNIMWFNRPVNAQITVMPDESADSLVRRFRKAVSMSGVMQECRRRRFFETPLEKIKRKRQALRKRRGRFKGPISSGDPFAEKAAAAAVDSDDDDDGDNWDYEPQNL